jgi:hypothetical protein
MTILKLTAAALTCLSLVVPYGLAQGRDSRDEVPAKPSQRLRLTAEVEPKSAKPGEPVSLKLVLKNVSSAPVRVNDNLLAERTYELTTVYADGSEAPRTALGRRLLEERGGSSMLVILAPGEEIQSVLDITKLYDVRQPGTYYSRATRVVLPKTDAEIGQTVEKAFSNPVVFSVTP